LGGFVQAAAAQQQRHHVLGGARVVGLGPPRAAEYGTHLSVTAFRLTPSEVVAATSANAARLFNIDPRKGSITPWADGDLRAGRCAGRHVER
jgi:hypothetical protein